MKKKNKNLLLFGVIAVALFFIGQQLFTVFIGEVQMISLDRLDNSRGELNNRKTIYGRVGDTTFIGASISIKSPRELGGGLVKPNPESHLEIYDANSGQVYGRVNLGTHPYDYGPTGGEWGVYSTSCVGNRCEWWFQYYICMEGEERDLKLRITDAIFSLEGLVDENPNANTSGTWSDYVLDGVIEKGNRDLTEAEVQEGIDLCGLSGVYFPSYSFRTMTPDYRGQTFVMGPIVSVTVTPSVTTTTLTPVSSTTTTTLGGGGGEPFNYSIYILVALVVAFVVGIVYYLLKR